MSAWVSLVPGRRAGGLEAQVDASRGRKDGMGVFEASAMFAHGASGHRLASGSVG